MVGPERTTQRLIALAALGGLLLNYPILFLFGSGGLLGGIPVLYLYLLVAWGLLILITALILEAPASGRAIKRHASSKEAPARDA